MASLAIHMKNHHKKPPHTLLKSTSNLTFSHLFSSSSSSDNNNNNNNNDDDNRKKFSSFFSDIKSKLQHPEQQPTTSRLFKFASQSTPNPSNATANDAIRKNLAEFRQRSTAPPDSKQSLSLQDIYKKNVLNSNPNANPNVARGRDDLNFSAIRESLSQLHKDNKGRTPLSLNKYKESFNPSPPIGESGKLYGGSTDALPMAVFGKELMEKEKKNEAEEDDLSKTAFYRMYSADELGKRLRELRPEGTKKEGEEGEESGFSLKELNERLRKLREMEEKQGANDVIGHLRQGLRQIEFTKDDKTNRNFDQRVSLLSELGGTPRYMLAEPKEQLVEKYFHPDNMSSAEKLKIELKKVRDEFKMHESDCGSARVQIAILTTEISHLSSVLHKKDKHSRRGLLAKVQHRKKLLKYLRRTDWDSYCFVLSKLSLRDNPDYKH